MYVNFVKNTLCKGLNMLFQMALVMRNLVEDTLRSSSSMMSNMAQILHIEKREQLSLLTSVANEMFEDQQVCIVVDNFKSFVQVLLFQLRFKH